MLRKIIALTLGVAVLPSLTACNDNKTVNIAPITPASTPPTEIATLSASTYTSMRSADPTADTLFSVADALAGNAKCDVKIMRMAYNTVGSAGETTNSSGVIMLPQGTTPNCSGARPTLLYAHGTTSDIRYDLSKFLTETTNPASAEAMILLALYASRGYTVIAPNYAGYADSKLDYHPYLDEKQQTTEMIDALEHVREHSTTIGARFSADLFVSGLSQGGYVAMATHKALQAKGTTVRASAPISGPYTVSDFVDTIMAGYVNGGATVFAPMYLTALEKAHDIYTQPTEVYSATFAAQAEDALPRTGGHEAAVIAGILPATAIFSGVPPELTPPLQPFQQTGFGIPHLLADSFRAAYLNDLQTNRQTPSNKIRSLVKEADLRDWTPTTPVMLCGSQNDPVVYFTNTLGMASYWSGRPNTFTLNLDSTPTTAPLNAFAPIAQQWQTALGNGDISGGAIHGQTGVYCGLAAYGFFQSQRTQ